MVAVGFATGQDRLLRLAPGRVMMERRGSFDPDVGWIEIPVGGLTVRIRGVSNQGQASPKLAVRD